MSTKKSRHRRLIFLIAAHQAAQVPALALKGLRPFLTNGSVHSSVDAVGSRAEPTLESDEDWQAMNCVLDNGVRILSRSRAQKVRDLKHRQHRPKLVIADDVEGLDWVRTQENRDKSDRWFRGDVLPSIDEHGRAVLIGNWLHTDGLMARLKNTGMFIIAV
jgi:prophage tail gpP-like protein